MNHLGEHYDTVIRNLSEKKSLLTNTMDTIQAQATGEEKNLHRKLLNKTDFTVRKLSIELGKRKREKLDIDKTHQMSQEGTTSRDSRELDLIQK